MAHLERGLCPPGTRLLHSLYQNLARLRHLDLFVEQQTVVSDDIGLRLEDVPDGSYTLAMGLYHPEARLPIVAPSGFTVSADRLLLNEAIRVP